MRRGRNAAVLTPQRNVKNLARRVEMQVANDWCLVPAMRNVSMRHAALETCYATCHMNVPKDQVQAATAAELVTAAEQLYSKLKRGTVTMHGQKRPINGDLRLLRCADDLSGKEKLLLDSYRRVTKGFAGSQEVRRKAGHCLFGLRATQGEGLFITISPNRRHSTLLMRLSRARLHDTSLQATDDVTAWRRRLAGANEPSVGVPNGVLPEEAFRELELPPIGTRQALNARDPLSSIHRYDVAIRVLLSRIAGTRMCMRCPSCGTSCSNKFGNNALPMGGSAGYCDHLGGMTEFQGDGTPHFHGTMLLVTVYQRSTLQGIADVIEKDFLTVDAINAYQAHICREDHYAHEEHERQEDVLEEAWKSNYEGPEHQGLCVMPSMYGADRTAALWKQTDGSGNGTVGRHAVPECL